MDNKKLKLNLILCVAIGVALFAALLTVASLYDLQISHTLTKGSLAEGKYYSTNGFALFFEIFGGCVVYIAGGVASIICVCVAIKMREGDRFFFIKELKGAFYKIVKWILIIAFSAFAVYEMYCAIHDMFKYTDRYLQDLLAGSGIKFTLRSGYLLAAQLVVAAVVSGLVFALLMRVKKENILTLVKLAILIFIVEALYLVVVEAIKTPIGRMRYRTMNVLGDFSYYTPWYKINGSRHATLVGIVGSKPDTDILIGAASDTCKSFPSGHTYCAAMSFVLVCLPDLFERFKKTWVKVLCWTVPAVYTLTVAVCRIVVGAHYFSDVLVGGTLSFTAIMIVREVLILKCAHFKALFGKKQPEVEAQPVDETTE
ncbi:MAG: phosphatase PAP2 family protein [Clostridia bacterium]|nr:phosphatase PAP2 family protein [Clostridia bacterium]